MHRNLNGPLRHYIGLVISFFLITITTSSASEFDIDDLVDYYAYDHTAPLEATSAWVGSTPYHDQFAITFKSVHGEVVTGNLFKPKGWWAGNGAFPAILYMHGHGQSSNYSGWLEAIVEYVEQSGHQPYLVLAIDAQYHGLRQEPGRDMLLQNFYQNRSNMATTVIDHRRAIDYLIGRGDVISDEIHVIGLSMGAIMGGILAAVDHRIDAVSLITGGGNWTAMLDSAQILPMVMLRRAMNGHHETAERFFDPIDPAVLIGKASPFVAVQMHNGTLDTFVPTGQVLYEAAGEPKEIYWYEATHTGIGEFKDIICARTLQWFLDY